MVTNLYPGVLMVQAEEDRRTCEDHEYAISTAVTNEWEGGYNAEITITNLTTEPMEDWSLSCTCQDEITNVWNGILESGEATGSDNSVSDGTIYSYLVHGDIYNTAISAGESVTVGITANGNTHTIENCELSCRQVEPSVISTPTDQSYSAVTYQADVKITDAWQNGYNVVVTVTNVSAEIIHNWGFIFQSNDTISNLYNAVELSKTDDNIRLIRNNRYNQDIPVGGSITFGYTASYEGTADVPSKFQLSTIETEVTTESYTVSTIIGEEWESGTVVQFLVENTSEKEIEDWTLEFDSTTQIQKLWNGVILSHTGNHYIIQNPEYEQNIAVGDTLVVGAVLSCDVGELENVAMHEVRVTEASVSGGNTGEPTPSENTTSSNTASENTTSGNSTGGNTVSENVSGNNVMVGIHYLSSAPGTGQLYYKEAHSGDFVAAPDGVPCVKNQFLISATDEVTFEQMKEYLVPYQAEIVGYIEFTNDYQVELLSDTPVEDIQVIIDKFETEPWVRIVGFNYIWLEKPAFCSTDPWYDKGSEDGYSADFAEHGENANGITEWDSSNPYGENWGIEAVNFEEALIYAGVISSNLASADSVSTEHLYTTKLGIIDGAFDIYHEDLNDNFADVSMNYTARDLVYYNENGIHLANLIHGTRVAGIMGAEFNNGCGISGICVKNEIYGYAWDGPNQNSQGEELGYLEKHVFEIKCALDYLVTSGVKVINYSYGLDVIPVAACCGNEREKANAVKYLDDNKKQLVYCIQELLNKGYDFLIISAAGNNNGYAYYRYCVENKYGFAKTDYVDPYMAPDLDTSTLYMGNGADIEKLNEDVRNLCSETVPLGDIDARYCNVFNYISEESECYNHIICVGAISNLNGDEAPFSNGGDRVDVLAPGGMIYSCSIEFNPLSHSSYSCDYGTSYAAPYVSGTVGLAYNVDPTLHSTDLKQCIINTATGKVLNCAAVIMAVKNGAVSIEDKCKVVINVKDTEEGALSGCSVEMHSWEQYRAMFFGGVWVTDSVGPSQPCYPTETDSMGCVSFYVKEGTYYALINHGDTGGSVCMIRVTSQDIGTTMYITEVVEEYSNMSNTSLTIQACSVGMDPLGDPAVVGLVVNFRAGWNNSGGNIEHTVTTAEYGACNTSIPKGTYTVEVIRNGRSEFFNIIVSEPFQTYSFTTW
ncbi:MAG TPA: cellulose binding domain-containing protein [Lachnospiraceae bacterium]|nr:cellulose binding domain-containing protein [Lachnospiraceae bacterium]